MAFFKVVVFAVILGFAWNVAIAQLTGEEREPTPEYVDAAFTHADAARVAAGFSSEIIENTSADPLANVTEAADLVVRASVLSQSYAYDATGTPYTHTTFLISDQLKGDHKSNVITLVQRGGPSLSNSDKILMVSNTHYFSVGEEELLFIDLDPHNSVESLKTNVLSRFRIYEDRIYNEDGYGVIIVPSEDGRRYRLAQSVERNPDPRFQHIHVGPHRLTKKFLEGNISKVDTREEGAGGRRAVNKRNTASEGADVAAFIALIRE